VRPLGVPDPSHFYQLASTVVDGWSSISKVVSGAVLSTTKPSDGAYSGRAVVPIDQPARVEARASHAARARHVLRLDVSQYYPSVYTHALDWAIRGKAAAKASPASTGLGPSLDKHVREAQSGQTIGIPIGPDTSFVLGELLLSKVDEEFVADSKRLRIHGFRYYDDYEIYAPTRTAAEEAEALLISALARWQLVANPYKIDIQSMPQPIEDEWISLIRRLPWRENASQERADLTALFDESFRIGRRFPREHVLSYALGRFINRDFTQTDRFVQKSNWEHFERLLIQSALNEPSVLPAVAHLLNWAQLKGFPVDSALLGDALNMLILDGSAKGHMSEVAWAIWTAISFGRRISARAGRAISSISDNVVALAALHAREDGRFRGAVDTTAWGQLMTVDSLRTENWLLAYEALVHGWLPPRGGPDYLPEEPEFDVLRAHDVRFYDTRAKLPGLPPPRKLVLDLMAALKQLGQLGPTIEPTPYG
jgi:hypothetical protein